MGLACLPESETMLFDSPGTARAHLREKRLHAVVGAVQIDVHHHMIISEGENFECTLWRIGSGRIYEHFDLLKLTQGLLCHLFNRFNI